MKQKGKTFLQILLTLIILVSATGTRSAFAADAGHKNFALLTPTVTITSDSPDPSYTGELVKVSVTVTGSGATPSGTVNLTGADTNCSITLSSGSGNCNINFASLGDKTITASYLGDSNYTTGSDTEDHVVGYLAGYKSSGDKDGYIVESSENSGIGGNLNSALSTLRVGDDSADRQYVSILSFDTASLPDDAIISRIYAKIKLASLTGKNPFTTHGNFLLDIKKGAFGNSSSLENIDFQAFANLVGTTAPSADTEGQWTTITLGAASISFINKTGVTQIRLRFSRDDNDDMGADYLSYYCGNATAANRPLLAVIYTLP
jgi:hypothetical protein